MSDIHDILTDREIEVLRLAASGKKDWQVAESLRVSTSTITTYWYRIKMKLSVRSRSEAIAFFATSRVSSLDAWSEPSDTISQKASSRQWSDLGAPFVSFVIDLSGRFRHGAGSVLKYVSSNGKPPSDDEWNRFIDLTIGEAGLSELAKTGKYKGTVKVGDRTFEVYALVTNTQISSNNAVSVTAIDISNHVQLQQEHDEGQNYFRSVLDQAPNMYFVWDFKLGNLTYVNHFAHHVLGYSAEQLKSMGWSVFDLIHPDDSEEAMDRISMISHMRKGEILTMPLRVRTREGTYVSFNTVATPFSVNEDGTVCEFLCACFDIASYHEQLDKLEAEHRVLQERYDAISLSSRNAAIGLMTIDVQGAVLAINNEGLRILGADRDGWMEVYSSRTKAALQETKAIQLGPEWLEESLLACQPLEIKVRCVSDYHGRPRKCMISVMPVRDADGSINRYTVTFYDFADVVRLHDFVHKLIVEERSNAVESSLSH